MTSIRPMSPDVERALVAGWLEDEWPGAASATATTTEPAPAERWIALRDGQPVGMAGLAGEADPFAPGRLPCLVELRVVPDWRGRGVGRSLCRHVAAQARARGLPALWLFTRDRQAWFQAQGWHEVTQAALHTRRGLEWATVMRLALVGDGAGIGIGIGIGIDADIDIGPRTRRAP